MVLEGLVDESTPGFTDLNASFLVSGVMLLEGWLLVAIY